MRGSAVPSLQLRVAVESAATAIHSLAPSAAMATPPALTIDREHRPGGWGGRMAWGNSHETHKLTSITYDLIVLSTLVARHTTTKRVMRHHKHACHKSQQPSPS